MQALPLEFREAERKERLDIIRQVIFILQVNTLSNPLLIQNN